MAAFSKCKPGKSKVSMYVSLNGHFSDWSVIRRQSLTAPTVGWTRGTREMAAKVLRKTHILKRVLKWPLDVEVLHSMKIFTAVVCQLFNSDVSDGSF